ncbi:cobalamin biosynthesis protein CobG [Streptomyces sp. NPDC049585]|uniref:cobalamin biosynthesis protein CobG n=1 Tax=Streptomyces sp. NPDC049585 TaxID=3155154 RepID=UPI00343ED8AA
MPALPARDRADACPGALRLHAADDGALARVRLPGGLLTAHQAAALADAAEALGDGHLDLTSRGNVQLRGLADACGAELAARLRAAGLLPSDRHDRIRNIAASPLGDGRVPQWVRELDRLLCSGEPDLSDLSGRFLFGLDDGRGDIVALSPDVTLIASADGALLCHGPTGPGLRVADRDAPRAAALAAAGFLAAQRASGTRAWRLRELPSEHRPAPEDLARRLDAAGIPSCPAAVAVAPGAPPGPGVVTGPGGRPALSVAAPLGRLTAAQGRLLAGTADRYGDGGLRVTPWRGVIVPGLAPGTDPQPRAHRAAALAQEAGLVTSAASAWHRAGACAGRPGCAKALADVRADAAAALASVRPGGSGALPVYWSGCERRCGHPGGRWVDVLATGEGSYRVTVRDGLREAPSVTVTAAELAGAVAAARTTT